VKWPLKRLAELGVVTTGSTPRTAESRFYGGDLPFVTPSELDVCLPITTTPRTLTDEGAAEARVLPEGAVMVCCIGSLGKIGIAGRSVATNQQINSVVFDRDKVWPGFGFYACRLLKPKLDCMAPATTLPIVSKSKFAELTIPVPPLAEQRRIAEVLDQAEALRAKRRAAVAQLDSLTQSLFLDLFGDTRKERTRWPTVLLEEIVRETKLGLVRGAQEFGPEFPIPYVRMNAITRSGELELGNVQRTHATEAEIGAYRLEPGDLLFNTRNSEELVGKTALYRGGGLHLFNNNLMRVRFTAKADPVFVAAAFKTAFVQHELNLRKSGTTNVFAIYYKDLRSLPLPLPPISLQREFARRVTAVEALKTAQRASLAELDALFATLQHRAFRREL
jgi:type I restriction enzyme S subunit